MMECQAIYRCGFFKISVVMIIANANCLSAFDCDVRMFILQREPYDDLGGRGLKVVVFRLLNKRPMSSSVVT